MRFASTLLIGQLHDVLLKGITLLIIYCLHPQHTTPPTDISPHSQATSRVDFAHQHRQHLHTPDRVLGRESAVYLQRVPPRGITSGCAVDGAYNCHCSHHLPPLRLSPPSDGIV